MSLNNYWLSNRVLTTQVQTRRCWFLVIPVRVQDGLPAIPACEADVGYFAEAGHAEPVQCIVHEAKRLAQRNELITCDICIRRFQNVVRYMALRSL